VTRNRRQIPIAEPAGDVGCLRECGVSRRRVALHNALDGGRNQQIPAGDGVQLSVVEDSLGSREPARGGSRRTALQESKPDPQGASSRPFGVVSIEARLMGAYPEGIALGVAADKAGCSRNAFEVFGFQGDFTVGFLKVPIRFSPRPSRERLTRTSERLDVTHLVLVTIVDRARPPSNHGEIYAGALQLH
jgi:hypothetical protein